MAEIKTSNNGKIYHYTSVNALINILRSGELWLFNITNMNDKKEVTNFIEELLKSIKNRVEENPNGFNNEQKKRYNELSKELKKQVENEPPFVMSFSNYEDDVSMWERYADNAQGANLEFDIYNLEPLRYSISKNPVIYDFDKNNIAEYNTVLEYVNSGILYNYADIDELVKVLVTTATSHKHCSFRSEDEVRLMTVRNAYEPYKYQRKDTVMVGNTLRKVLKLNLLKYCENEHVKIEDLITGITLGPKSNQDIEALKEFLIKNGYNKLAENVKFSKCPLR